MSAIAGTYYSEPIEFVETARSEIGETSYSTSTGNYSYNWSYTRASRIGYLSDIGEATFDPGDCDGDGCGMVLLFIVVVVVVVICVMASAMIPHFWVVATCLLLTNMFLVTLRELLIVPSDLNKHTDSKNAYENKQNKKAE